MGNGWKTAKALFKIKTRNLCCTKPDEDLGWGSKYPCQKAQQIASDSDSGRSNLSKSFLHLFAKNMSLSRASSCAICLEVLREGRGQALFTAECSHVFHFSCIAANVRHGNFICPVCRAKWKEVPCQSPPDPPAALHRKWPSPFRYSRHLANDPTTSESVLWNLRHAHANLRHLTAAAPSEPTVFDDDEPLNPKTGEDAYVHSEEQYNSQWNDGFRGESIEISCRNENDAAQIIPVDQKDHENALSFEKRQGNDSKIELTAFVEMESILYSENRDSFTVLVHLKSPPAAKRGYGRLHSCPSANSPDQCNDESSWPCMGPRTPIDLVTVLDMSGSMSGGKLRLLKQAMAFLIAHLGSQDRLSVVAFSTTAKRVLPLRRMVEQGRQSALRAVNGLIASGGTNIADGLSKGAKVLEDRRVRNPVAAIILLSDGQDKLGFNLHTELTSSSQPRGKLNEHQKLLLSFKQHTGHGQHRFPVHTFGLGTDHDAIIMHSIAQTSGGTYSFIQTEAAVQDAFAQCMGGLLSVVVQDMKIKVFCSVQGSIQLKKLHAGVYESSIDESCHTGLVKLGDLYADEERDILVDLKLPATAEQSKLQKILKVECTYKDPVSGKLCSIFIPDVSISRPKHILKKQLAVSIEVDSQRNRLRTAQAIAEAGAMADRGDIAGAQRILEVAKTALHESTAWAAGDQLSKSLEAEVCEIQLRMSNRHQYERTGKAYALSAHSSHSGQRAAARGECVSRQAANYQTPSMVNMVFMSQTFESCECASRHVHH